MKTIGGALFTIALLGAMIWSVVTSESPTKPVPYTVEMLDGETEDCIITQPGAQSHYDASVEFKGAEACVTVEGYASRCVRFDNPQSSNLASIPCRDFDNNHWIIKNAYRPEEEVPK